MVLIVVFPILLALGGIFGVVGFLGVVLCGVRYVPPCVVCVMFPPEAPRGPQGLGDSLETILRIFGKPISDLQRPPGLSRRPLGLINSSIGSAGTIVML